jgi:Sulfotransferase domain
MSQQRKPDFFIVGAPKSGTTSLFFYLKEHPEIFMPARKELYCFCTDLHFQYPLLSEVQFRNYYRDFKNEKRGGDATVWNLLSAKAAKNILEFNPDSRIIILLRNPVEVMQSLHANHVFNGNEPISDFEEALSVIDERKKGNNIPHGMKSPAESLFYYDAVDYTPQLERYFSVFGNENVKVILFDDFIRNVAAIYSDVLKFLEVGKNFKPDFSIHNKRKAARSRTLTELVTQAPEPLKKAAKVLVPHQSHRRDVMMNWIWKINSKKGEPQPLNDRLQKVILQRLAPSIQKTEELLHRDLSAWLRNADK